MKKLLSIFIGILIIISITGRGFSSTSQELTVINTYGSRAIFQTEALPHCRVIRHITGPLAEAVVSIKSKRMVPEKQNLTVMYNLVILI